MDKFKQIADFVSDCQCDRLPTVSTVDPPFTLADDHPAHDPFLVQKFIAFVVDALTNSESITPPPAEVLGNLLFRVAGGMATLRGPLLGITALVPGRPFEELDAEA